MSLQAVWIVASSAAGCKEGKLLFSRYYQTYIRKCKQIDGERHVPIPEHAEFVRALLFEMGYKKEGNQKFVPSRDSCDRLEQKPVYEITTKAGPLWPLVVFDQQGLLFCCLPFVSQGTDSRPALIDMPGVTLGFTLLCAMSDYLRGVPYSEVSNKTGDLYAFLTQAAPFGTLLDTTVESVVAKMNNRHSLAAAKTQKQPAWKPVLHKGKNHIYLSITEYVRAVQYDRENIDDVWDVYGTVTCKAELEGTMPCVTLTISQPLDRDATPLDHLLTHPTVQSADAYIIDEDRGRAIPRRIRFTPPLEMFTLCHYTVSRMSFLPITGSFEMFVEGMKVKVNLRLKLSERVKNAFEYCELQIPFINRGPVTIIESDLNHGNVLLSPDKNVVVWNLGPKFPVKTQEVNMSAVLTLGEPRKGGTLEDQFCTGQNAYAQLFFKIADFTQSGCFIDAKSIQVSPSLKYKLTTVREYQSVEYKLWNVHGDALISAVPKCLYEPPSPDL